MRLPTARRDDLPEHALVIRPDLLDQASLQAINEVLEERIVEAAFAQIKRGSVGSWTRSTRLRGGPPRIIDPWRAVGLAWD